ncbi:hypothetical protein TSAR_000810 [Trichomalopsis sarcophagae]|uniref:Uncharacterized protein n=1 Tax=Trichomalopsis sarcophagae TaxID=543379 RepID=A0A232FLD7_9HYME|nr:hypothetical protein TSAR_000810 [Trichomalopsis sarcophagae]
MQQATVETAHAAAMSALLRGREARSMKLSISRLAVYGLRVRGSVEVKRDRLLRACLHGHKPDVPWYPWDMAEREEEYAESEIERVVLGKKTVEMKERKTRRANERPMPISGSHSSESKNGGNQATGPEIEFGRRAIPSLPVVTAITTNVQMVSTSQAKGTWVTTTASLPQRPIATAAHSTERVCRSGTPTAIISGVDWEKKLKGRSSGESSAENSDKRSNKLSELSNQFNERAGRIGEYQAHGMTYEQAREYALRDEIEREGERVFHETLEEKRVKQEEEELDIEHQFRLHVAREAARARVQQIYEVDRRIKTLSREDERRPKGFHRSISGETDAALPVGTGRDKKLKDHRRSQPVSPGKQPGMARLGSRVTFSPSPPEVFPMSNNDAEESWRVEELSKIEKGLEMLLGEIDSEESRRKWELGDTGRIETDEPGKWRNTRWTDPHPSPPPRASGSSSAGPVEEVSTRVSKMEEHQVDGQDPHPSPPPRASGSSSSGPVEEASTRVSYAQAVKSSRPQRAATPPNLMAQTTPSRGLDNLGRGMVSLKIGVATPRLRLPIYNIKSNKC